MVPYAGPQASINHQSRAPRGFSFSGSIGKNRKGHKGAKNAKAQRTQRRKERKGVDGLFCVYSTEYKYQIIFVYSASLRTLR